MIRLPTNPVGINETIYDSLNRDNRLMESYGIRNVNRTIRQFLGETSFQHKIDHAINISKKALSRHGKQVFYPFLTQLVDIEAGVQRFFPELRDHISHSTYVFLLGLTIMSKLSLYGEGIYIDPLSWKIASLLHDIGYPLQLFSGSITEYLELLNRSIDRVVSRRHARERETYPISYDLSFRDLGTLQFSRTSDAYSVIQERLNQLGINVDLLGHSCVNIQRCMIDHGVVSSLIVLKTIDSLYYTENPRRDARCMLEGLDWGEDCFNRQILDAIAAISIHSIMDHVETISYELSPIAYLLVFCDTLQEWDRFSQGQIIYNPLNVRLQFNPNSIRYRLNLEEHKIETIRRVFNKLQSNSFQIEPLGEEL